MGTQLFHNRPYPSHDWPIYFRDPFFSLFFPSFLKLCIFLPEIFSPVGADLLFLPPNSMDRFSPLSCVFPAFLFPAVSFLEAPLVLTFSRSGSPFSVVLPDVRAFPFLLFWTPSPYADVFLLCGAAPRFPSHFPTFFLPTAGCKSGWEDPPAPFSCFLRHGGSCALSPFHLPSSCGGILFFTDFLLRFPHIRDVLVGLFPPFFSDLTGKMTEGLNRPLLLPGWIPAATMFIF